MDDVKVRALSAEHEYGVRHPDYVMGVIEGVNDYDGDVWNVVLILELNRDGMILRDTRYYGERSDPPDWRSGWVEPIE